MATVVLATLALASTSGREYTTGMRIDRMLSMTVMLLNRERVTAREMSERFEVSVRTIYRDLEAMDLAGIPIVSYPGGGGGYSLLESYTLDRQLLSYEGMLAILTALRGINTSLADSKLDETIEKVSALIPQDRRGEAGERPDRFRIDLSPWGMRDEERARLRIIRQAMDTNTVISFAYRNGSGAHLRRSVEPHTLVYKGSGWYLLAFCRLRSAFRLFRISRMRELRGEHQRFTPRGDADSALEENWIEAQSTEFLVRFRESTRQLVEEYFSDAELTTEGDGCFIARFSLPENEWVYAMLLGYGDQAEVLEPARVRRLIAERAKKTADLYEYDRALSQP